MNAFLKQCWNNKRKQLLHKKYTSVVYLVRSAFFAKDQEKLEKILKVNIKFGEFLSWGGGGQGGKVGGLSKRKHWFRFWCIDSQQANIWWDPPTGLNHHSSRVMRGGGGIALHGGRRGRRRETCIGKGDLEFLDGLLLKVSTYWMCADSLKYNTKNSIQIFPEKNCPP